MATTRKSLTHTEQQVYVVRHKCDLPDSHLWVIARNLGKFFFDDGTTKGTGHQMREIRRGARYQGITFEVSEKRMATINAECDHIHPRFPVLLPIGAAVLIMFDVAERYAPRSLFIYSHRREVD
jgi:hypothetical protein